MVAFLTYWLYIILIIFITFVPGFAVASRFKNLNTAEQLAISFGFSFVILALLAPFFALKWSLQIQLVFMGVMVASLWCLLKKRFEIKFEIDARLVVLVLLISLISKFFLQTLWEYPVMGGDWFWHAFRIPYAFEQGDWSPPVERPALFNLLIYSYHNLLGTSLYQYWVSQIISVVINSVYMFPAYLIAKKAFGDSVARVSVLFMLVTPFLVFNTLYTWPKNAAMYGILMMVYFLFFSEHDIKLRYPLAGFFAWLGFWFHNYAVFYIGIAVLLLIYKEKMYKGIIGLNNLKRLFYFLVVMLILLTPHFAWVYSYYGTISTSKFIYYPFAVKGYESAFADDKQELLNTFYSTPIREIIMIRISNAVVTLLPAALPVNPIAASFPTYNPIYYYSHDYPGALSTLLYLVVVAFLVRYLFRKTKTDVVLVSFVLLPIAIYLVLYGWKEWGLLTGGLHPTVPILIILAFNEISKISAQKIILRLTWLIFFFSALELLIYGSLIGKFYYTEGGLNGVIEMGQGFLPNFGISAFVSAHFLLSGNIDFYGNLLLSLILLLYLSSKLCREIIPCKTG